MIDLKKMREEWAVGPANQAATREVFALIDRCEAAEVALATARATAMEEAAQLLDEEFLGSKRTDSERNMGIRVGAAIRALAPSLPACVRCRCCHICGSIDAVLMPKASLCSKGHGTI